MQKMYLNICVNYGKVLVQGMLCARMEFKGGLEGNNNKFLNSCVLYKLCIMPLSKFFFVLPQNYM